MTLLAGPPAGAQQPPPELEGANAVPRPAVATDTAAVTITWSGFSRMPSQNQRAVAGQSVRLRFTDLNTRCFRYSVEVQQEDEVIAAGWLEGVVAGGVPTAHIAITQDTEDAKRDEEDVLANARSALQALRTAIAPLLVDRYAVLEACRRGDTPPEPVAREDDRAAAATALRRAMRQTENLRLRAPEVPAAERERITALIADLTAGEEEARSALVTPAAGPTEMGADILLRPRTARVDVTVTPTPIWEDIPTQTPSKFTIDAHQRFRVLYSVGALASIGSEQRYGVITRDTVRISETDTTRVTVRSVEEVGEGRARPLAPAGVIHGVWGRTEVFRIGVMLAVSLRAKDDDLRVEYAPGASLVFGDRWAFGIGAHLTRERALVGSLNGWRELQEGQDVSAALEERRVARFGLSVSFIP